MKIINLNFLLIIPLFSYLLVNCNPFAEQISGGQVSKDIEYEIKEILCGIKIPIIKVEISKLTDSKILVLDLLSISHGLPIIRKTSRALAEHNSDFAVGGFYKKYNYFYVNENFYNQLNSQEKRYWILDSIDSEIFTQKNPVDLAKVNILSFGYKALGLLSISLGIIGLFLQSKRYSDAELFYLQSGIIGTYSLMCFLGHKLSLNQYNYERSRLYIDKEVVKRHNCLNEAIFFLEKILANANLLILNDEQIKEFGNRLANLRNIRI